VDNWKKITNSQNSVMKKSFGGTFSFSNCHIIGLDTGSLVLIVFGNAQNNYDPFTKNRREIFHDSKK
jgi:hypothetical protein